MDGYAIEFPPAPGAAPQDELAAVTFPDGHRELLRLHDYERIFAVPGLYEEIVQHRLQCRSPDQVAAMLAGAASRLGWAPGDVRVLDVGAGNGVSGEALAARGLRPVVALDILPAARTATLRDRPGLYDVCLTADLLALDDELREAIGALAPNALTVVGAVGSGHLPPAAFRAAADLLANDALIVFTTPADVDDPDAEGVRAMAALTAPDAVELGRERYRHRLTTSGDSRWWEAVALHVSAR